MVDKIQRTWPIHAATLETIAKGMVNRFVAEFCLICLVDRDTGVLKMQVAHDRAHVMKILGKKGIRQLAQEALDESDLFPFRVTTLQFEFAKPLDCLHCLVLPVALGINQPRGVILLARSKNAFTHADRAFFGKANWAVGQAA